MAYIGQLPTNEFAAAPQKDVFTGDGSTTTFDLATAVASGGENALEVYIDNVRQEPGSGKAFTLGNDGSNNLKRITFTAAPANSAAIYVLNALTNVQAIAPAITDLNGVELILDANGNTSITADTDDTIDIKVGGADDFQITANTFTALSGSSIVTPTLTVSGTATIPAGVIGLAAIDIDGGTDIGAAVVDADLFIIDDGAGGANRKVTASRLKTYAQSGLTSDSITDANSNTKIQVEESSDDDTIRFDVSGVETSIMTAKGLELGAAGGFFLNQTTNTQTVTIAAAENAMMVGPVAFSGTVTVAGVLAII